MIGKKEKDVRGLYKTLFSEYGVTILEGLETEREDELALAFCRLAHEPPWDGVKILTDKENSVYSAFSTEKICFTEEYEARTSDGGTCTEERLALDFAEKIAPHVDNCRLIVLDLKLFSEEESFFRYRRIAEALKLEDLAARMDIGILIPIHFEEPSAAWRTSVPLAGRHVQVVRLFYAWGEYFMEIFGGRYFPEENYVLLDIETSGLNENRDRVLSVTADKFMKGKLTERFFSFVSQEGKLPSGTEGLTGIRDDMLEGKPDLDAVMDAFAAFCGFLSVYADGAPFVRKFLNKYDLEIVERRKRPVSSRLFDELIDGMGEDPLIALCGADVKQFRDRYSFCEMKIVRAEEEAELASAVSEIAAEPYDAFTILLRIPEDALKETIRCLDICVKPTSEDMKTAPVGGKTTLESGKTVLIGAVRSDIFDAVVGCYKKRETRED